MPAMSDLLDQMTIESTIQTYIATKTHTQYTHSQIDRMTPKWSDPDFYFNSFGSVPLSKLSLMNYLVFGKVYFVWCLGNLVSSTLNVAACKLPAFQAISMPSCGGIFHGFLPLYSGPVLGNYTPLKVIPDISSSYMGPTVSYFTILGFELIPVRD